MARPPLDSFVGVAPKPSLDSFVGVPTSPTASYQSNVPFAASTNDNPLQAGLKAAGNLPKSVFNFGKGIVEAVTNPIDTVKGVGKVALGGAQKVLPGEQAQEGDFNAFTEMLKARYGSLQNLQKTATEDPFGFGSDVLGLVSGGATLAGKAGAVGRAIPKVSSIVTSPASKAASTVGGGVAKTARYGISQATGLNPETITELVRNPQKFKNISPEIRVETANVVKDALDERLTELSELGKGYESIRQSGAIIPIPEGSVKSILDKHGIKFENGEIKTTAESTPLSAVDKAELKEFLSTYGNEPIMSGNSILNARSELSRISGFDKAKTGNLQRIGRDIRDLYDNTAKRAIPELPMLDAQYSPEVNLLKQLKKDIFDPKTGELKDAAISKIANINGKGKEQLLERVKQIVPDIEERVEIIKVVEDIERSSGIKVGTYTRSLVGGAGALTGNIPAIVGAIISQPQIAVPLLKGAGYVGQKAVPILNAVKAIANDVNNFTLPPQFLNREGQLKLGASIEDASKGLQPLAQEARKYKSAEEFVNNQPTYYHTTKSENVSAIESRGFSGEIGDMSKASGGNIQKGVFLYPEKSSATSFGKNFKNPSVVETKIQGKVYDANNQSKYGWEDDLQTQEIAKNKAIIDQLRKDGFVGVKSTELGTDAVFVFEPTAVKTKSQLTDFYNKVMGKAKKP